MPRLYAPASRFPGRDAPWHLACSAATRPRRHAARRQEEGPLIPHPHDSSPAPTPHTPRRHQDPLAQPARVVRAVAHPQWVVPLARLGYAARGMVYAVVGGLALRAVFGEGGELTGP